MFQAAATNYSTWYCSVGDGSINTKGLLYGGGCTIDNIHILTARHVWFDVANKHDWPMVLKQDGTFRCEVAFESSEYDIMLLRAVARISEKVPNAIDTYPIFSDAPLHLGMSVGFMTRLRGHKPTGEQFSRAYFASATVSVNLPAENGRASQFALSGAAGQVGWSGSPVFRPDSSIVGVLTGGWPLREDLNDLTSPISTLPLVAPIFPLIEYLKVAIIESRIDPKTLS
jgi:hypothetical protein